MQSVYIQYLFTSQKKMVIRGIFEDCNLSVPTFADPIKRTFSDVSFVRCQVNIETLLNWTESLKCLHMSLVNFMR